ncbi:ADP-ribosylglycohydrolase family protein [Eleftheria terrae]|uniref:ADP-ribosylglycohydrolase family protein n=1 Tax=Eleftheria terrae TaxID=1597781 RepID=UPI00263AD3FF|nr:ADP-ribosylglycohydrolase family protein [Eleftheria terrae]WKB55008.1 ADP-ribosylglycohydrolase family protein [Eleftheria terrae]
MTSMLDRYRGCLLGLACGDAVGTTVEFCPRGSFEPLTDMVGGGPFELAAGQWTDDTSMALCLAASLLHCGGFDARDQMNRYVNWWQWGYYSATGECFDIGMTVLRALQRYQLTGEPMAGSTDPATAGNGSLMRLAPVVLHAHPDAARVRALARASSATTHAAPEALACCELLALCLHRALAGAPKDEVLDLGDVGGECERVASLAAGSWRGQSEARLRGSGYCVESLEAALWCFATTSSFEAAVLRAANLGDDADTTAAITGQLAGAYYGVAGLPAHWLARLHLREEIDRLAGELWRSAARPAAAAPG